MKAVKLKWRALLLICVFNTMLSYAQLSDFVLQVTPITESCTANGRLNFEVTNTTVGATILYTIYKLPNTTVPIAVMSANTLTGLVSGNYRVVATQSLGELSNSQQQDAFISDTIIDLAYNLTSHPVVCGNDGQITVTVTHSAAVSYEIFSGPAIRPLQTSNVFNNLPGGNYIIRVFDACGEGLARSYTLPTVNSDLIIRTGYVSVSNCGTVLTLNTSFENQTGSPNTDPYTIQLTINPPTGLPIVYNYSSDEYFIHQIIPTFYTQPYTYSLSVTNRCGRTFSRNNIPIIIAIPVPSVNLTLTTLGPCDERLNLTIDAYNLTAPISVVFLNSPPGFNPLTFNSNPGPYNSTIIDYYDTSLVHFPEGNYTVQVTDACGIIRTASIEIGYPTPQPPTLYKGQKVACAVGFGSLNVMGNLASITLLSAPSSYPISVPHDYTNNLVNGSLHLGVIPEGIYTFSFAGNCGGTNTSNINVVGYHPGATTINITENCDSFNLFLNHITNTDPDDSYYYLQKYNPITNQWVHPVTGSPGNFLDNYYLNSIYLDNNFNNLNIHSSGSFRILERHEYLSNQSYQYCPANVIYTFDYTIGPRITNVYSFACENSLYDAIVIAEGYAPLKYRITTKNGQPFFINNNFSNIFLGLEPTVYNFQIEDACGNILNSLFDISNPSLFPIQATPFCEGLSGSLSVPAFSFLNYQWRKGDDPTIISISSTLSFPAFHVPTDNGIYHVRVFYTGNPNSCIDFVVDYQINISSSNPQAGNGQTVQYCGEQGIIDLFSFLTGNYDSNGTWQEITNSGFLTNNLWNSTTIDSGNFQFKYTVNGSCNTSDASISTITIKEKPEAPTAFLEQAVCDSRALNLQATTIPFVNYLWSGPNGFTSSEQNPTIENITTLNAGIYTVKAFFNDCESAESNVEVAVNAIPEFTLESGCINNRYTITATPINNSFDALSANYSWTGPDGYTSLQNPIQITGLPSGVYEVTITNSAGCSTLQSIQIPGTQCEIPNVITPNDDFVNDIFDLTGLLVDKLEVYNRWGRLVYEQNDYTNQWHGQNNKNQPLPDSTYFYIAFLQSGENKQGWVFVTGQ